MGRNKKKHTNKIHKLNEKKKIHRHNQTKIDKLKKVFEALRNETIHTVDSSCNDSVIVLENAIQSPEVNNKRKFSTTSILGPNKCMRIEGDNPVMIPDDDDDDIIINTPRKNLNNAPKDCSTPITASTSKLIENNNTDTIDNFNADVSNLTKEINRDSFLTIDLTTETIKTDRSVSLNNTVIDLDNTNDTQDCTFVSMSNADLSISGESDITVLHNPARKSAGRRNMKNFVNGIDKLNATEKGQLLQMITQKIFSGCNVPMKVKKGISFLKTIADKTTDTIEDTYIKQVILGEKASRNSIGSNIYNPAKDPSKSTGLRMVVIDGSNVAMDHGKGRVFSVKGLKICIDYFLKRGHLVKAFVPRFRCKWGKSSDPGGLDELQRQGLVVYTPSREVQGRLITSYDDRYIVQCAAEFDGVIVSGDNYRDLAAENPRWRTVIENRLLQFTWVEDMLMFPKDPLGRNGPTLEQLLRHPTRS